MTTFKDDEKKSINTENYTNIENQSNNQESKNTFGDVERKIENVFKTIEKSLNQTTLMFLRIGILHPEIGGKVHELKEKFDNNKQTLSWEFTSGILWEIRDLLNKYGNDKEKAITKDLGECLYDLQQIRSERHKARNFKDLVVSIDENVGKDVKKFVGDIDMVKMEDVVDYKKEKRNLSGGPFIYKSAA